MDFGGSVLRVEGWGSRVKGQGSRVKGQGLRTNLVFGIFFDLKKLSLTCKIFYLTNYWVEDNPTKIIWQSVQNHISKIVCDLIFIIFFKKCHKLFKAWNLLLNRLLTTKNWCEKVQKRRSIVQKQQSYAYYSSKLPVLSPMFLGWCRIAFEKNFG